MILHFEGRRRVRRDVVPAVDLLVELLLDGLDDVPHVESVHDLDDEARAMVALSLSDEPASNDC